MRIKTVLFVIAVLALSTLIGCGGGSMASLGGSPTPTVSLQSITVTPAVGSIAINKTQQFTATGKYSDGTKKDLTKSVTWSSSTLSVATISKSGSLTAVGAGQTSIVAKSGSISGSQGLKVTNDLVSIAVKSTASSVIVGSAVQLSAMGTYQDGKSATALSSVTWTSSSSSISVSNTGLATGVAIGASTITAKSGSISGSASLNATDDLVSISIKASASSVNVASSLQLTAMGTYQDGKPATALSSVGWSTSANSLATISNAGLVSGVHGGSVTVTATSGSLSGKLNLSVVAVLEGLAVRPTGPAIQIGGGQQFKALAVYNDGTSKDLSSTATWSSSDATIATIDGNGLASGVSAAPATITANSAGMTATTALNVVSKVYATFAGPYVFTLTSSDTRGPSFFAGAITPDGSGSISGVEDANTASGVQQNVAVKGTYVAYPDGRGTITISPNAAHPSGITFRMILAAAGASGSLAEFDSLGNAHGSLTSQNPAALNAAAINGTYVFRLSGIDTSATQPYGVVGEIRTNGAGAISGGLQEVNDASVISTHVGLSATIYSVASNGRGTLQLKTATATTNYAFYIVDSTQLYLVQIDAATASPFAASGVAELQTIGSFTPSTLSGNFAFLMQRPIVAPSGQVISQTEFADIGSLNMDGVSAFTGQRDHYDITGTFAMNVNGINGRGTINTCPSGQPCSTDQRLYFFYMVTPAKMFLIETNTLPNYQSSNPVVGEAQLQSGAPYSEASLVGTYAMHSDNPIASYSQSLLWLNFDGTGNIAGIQDSFVSGLANSYAISPAAYIFDANDVGAEEIELTTPGSVRDYVLFLVSPQKAWVHALGPDQDGGLDAQ